MSIADCRLPTGDSLAGMKRRDLIFLGLVAVLPLHTVFLSAWVSWKPFLLLLAVLLVEDVVDGVRERRWPWNRAVSQALAVFAVVIALGFPAAEYRDRFFRLGFAVAVGACVMLVVERRLRRPGMADKALRVIFWAGSAMAVTAVTISVVLVGGVGERAISAINEVPGVFRVFKPAYLETGFLALTNWHQDPGYGASWTVLWAFLVIVASVRGLGTRRWWLDGAVVGGLAFAVIMGFSRTGWLAFLISIGLGWLALGRDVSWVALGKRWLAAFVTVVILLVGVSAVDVSGSGGDLDLQFAFRFSQGWDLLADLTGWFASSETFEDRFEPSEERADVWPEYIDMWQANPLLGVGLSVGWQTNSIGQEPHNLIIELLAETGLVGLAAFLGLLVTVIRQGRGAVGAVALATAFLPSITQTVLFEPAWWFAASWYLAAAPNSELRPIPL